MSVARIEALMIKDKDYPAIKILPIELDFEAKEEHQQIAIEYSLKVLKELGIILTIPESKYKELYKKSYSIIKDEEHE